MVLLIDTASASSAVAVIAPGGQPVAERVEASGRAFHVAEVVRALVNPAEVTAIGVATGPGSFTGLRSGVAFAVGLAMSRALPLRALSNLSIAARRAGVEATGLAEAGRGRVYFLVPGDVPRLGSASDVPHEYPATGWLRQATFDALEAAGVELLPESSLRPFAEAAFAVYGESPEVAYATVSLQYMEALERV